MGRAEATKEQDFGADICDVWRIVTDTDRMGRALGYDKIEVKPLEGSGAAARHLITTKIAGLLVEYEETPFEWVEPVRFSSRRVCRRGPLKRIETDWTLSKTASGGTHVKLHMVLEPSLGIMMPLAKLATQKATTNMLAEVARVDERIKKGEHAFVLPPAHPVVGHALERTADDLKKLVPPSEHRLVEKLITLIKTGADPDVRQIRPFELADEWKADRREVVSLCLAATVAGVLELSWNIVCPSCRVSSDQAPSLDQIGDSGHCHLCDLSFGVDLDRAVEATFRPAPAVRAVEYVPLCISGPARTPHVLAQVILPANGAASIVAPEEPGRYRLFLRGGATASVEVSANAPRETPVVVDGVAEKFDRAQVEVAPGGNVNVEHRAGDERHVKLERIEWATKAATAHVVSTIPAFRKLFAGNVLRPNLTLKVSAVALLFTDLTESTALYTREGDAEAFRLVQDHFDLLTKVIEEHRGVVVKTIGDAIMAAFDDPADAVRASVAMQRAWPAFRAAHASGGATFLRVGVHAGPCYVVTANKILDYFGQTVNIAARLQAKAEGTEIVLGAELAERAQASGWLDGAVVKERFAAPLKGLDGPIRAVRLIVPDVAIAASA
jgi:class 3 adenylate cyclase